MACGYCRRSGHNSSTCTFMIDGVLQTPAVAAGCITTWNFAPGIPSAASRHMNPDGSVGGWVATSAYVAASVHVGYDARVYGRANVADGVRIINEASVYGNANVSGLVRIREHARVYGNSVVSGNALIMGSSARVQGSCSVYGNATIRDGAQVDQNATVCGFAIVRGSAVVTGRSFVSEGEYNRGIVE